MNSFVFCETRGSEPKLCKIRFYGQVLKFNHWKLCLHFYNNLDAQLIIFLQLNQFTFIINITAIQCAYNTQIADVKSRNPKNDR